MDDKKELDFPIYTIVGDESFNEEVYQATTLHYSIQELSDILLEDIEQIKSIGKKLNIYINNIIKRDEPFNYENHIIIFNENKELCIYSHEEIDEFLDKIYDDNDDDLEDEDDLVNIFHEETNYLKDIPPTKDKYKLNKKQLATCEDLVEAYNVTYIEYEYSMIEFNEMNDYYNSIIDGIKDDLKNTKFLNKVSDDYYKAEQFDDNIHELLLTKDTSSETWKFVYIRKEDHDKFFNLLEKNAKTKQP